MLRSATIFLALALTVSACGTTPGERGVSGGGLGAAAGAVNGAVTGLSVLNGALIGAAVGAVGGALTRPEQINLGKPAWESRSDAGRSSTAAGYAGYAEDPLVRDIQSGLASLGYDAGPSDGRLGPRTRTAIADYQRDHKLLVDEHISPQLLDHILASTRRG